MRHSQNVKIGAYICMFTLLLTGLMAGLVKAEDESNSIEVYPTKLIKPLDWPKAAQHLKRPAWVIVKFDVDSRGRPINAKGNGTNSRRGGYVKHAQEYIISGLLFEKDKGRKGVTYKIRYQRDEQGNIVPINVSSSSPEDDPQGALVGNWVSVEKGVASLFLKKDKTATFSINTNHIAGTWKADTSDKLIKLDIDIKKTGVSKAATIPLILKFMGRSKIKIKLGSPISTRATKFGLDKDPKQIILEKQ